jgi:hypothetical protein
LLLNATLIDGTFAYDTWKMLLELPFKEFYIFNPDEVLNADLSRLVERDSYVRISSRSMITDR